MSKKWDSDFLAFSRNSRRGVLVILFLFLVLAAIPRVYGFIFWEKPDIVVVHSEEIEDQDKSPSELIVSIEIIDPNALSAEKWMELGLSKKQAQSIINFKNKIGGFKDAETLKKAYGISDDFFEKIKDKLIFTSKVNETNKHSKEQFLSKDNNISGDTILMKKDTLIEDAVILNLIDLNSAAFDDLMGIKGIGNYFAEKIIDLRIQRGGFVSVDQLLEIQYLDEEKLEQIKPYLAIDLEKINKININTVTIKRLSKHPDITWEMARSILDLRSDLGGFCSLDELLLSAHIDMRRFKNLKNYLTIEE